MPCDNFCTIGLQMNGVKTLTRRCLQPVKPYTLVDVLYHVSVAGIHSMAGAALAGIFEVVVKNGERTFLYFFRANYHDGITDYIFGFVGYVVFSAFHIAVNERLGGFVLL